jgi:molecular chaperone DnaK
MHLEEQRKALEDALKENKSSDEIKKLSEDLQQTMYAISQAAYSQVQQEGAQSANSESASSEQQSTSNNNDDDVIDAEYTKE